MLKVVQAFDRVPIAEIETDDATALERKLQAAERAFAASEMREALVRQLGLLREPLTARQRLRAPFDDLAGPVLDPGPRHPHRAGKSLAGPTRTASIR